MMIQPQNRESMQNIFPFGLNSYLIDRVTNQHEHPLTPVKQGYSYLMVI